MDLQALLQMLQVLQEALAPLEPQVLPPPQAQLVLLPQLQVLVEILGRQGHHQPLQDQPEQRVLQGPLPQ